MCVCRWLVGHANIGVAWLFALCYSVALVFASTWMVVTWAPQVAATSGTRAMHCESGIFKLAFALCTAT